MWMRFISCILPREQLIGLLLPIGTNFPSAAQIYSTEVPLYPALHRNCTVSLYSAASSPTASTTVFSSVMDEVGHITGKNNSYKAYQTIALVNNQA